jgi:DNA-binding beta-propeller fold protein YncE
MTGFALAAKALALLALLAVPVPAVAGPAPHYGVTGSIAGPDGGWDLLAVDAAGRRLFIARTANVTVVALRGAHRVSSLGAVDRGHAAVPIPRRGLLLVTSGNDGRARVYDTARGGLVADIAVGRKPDAAIWDERLAAVLVMNAQDGTLSVVDPARGTVTRTIRLAPGLELPALDEHGILFVNNEESNLIHVIDPATGTVRDPIPLAGCEGPTGLGYDRRGHRLIAACSNGKAAVVDTVTGRLVQLLDIGRGPDGVAIDEGRGVAFIPCGRDGELDVIPLRGGGPLAVAERVRTEAGARTVALDPVTGALYLPTARFGPPPAGGGRPPMLPGSFHVLIVTRH